MEIVREVDQLREYNRSLPQSIQRGFVPTMGALHAGHASLIQKSLEENTHTTVSIFVNPTQFAPEEDLATYPRPEQADQDLLRSLGVDCLFQPLASDIYSSNNILRFSIDGWGGQLEGQSRPGHLEGVLQVVSILFNLVQPDRAYFGLKDYQQCLLIQQLVAELHFPLEIRPCPIVREQDGLALSSRNAYLSPTQRKAASGLYRMLMEVKELAQSEPTLGQAMELVKGRLKEYPQIRLDYFQILNGRTLEAIPSLASQYLPHAFVAAFLGDTRLIDNMSLWEG